MSSPRGVATVQHEILATDTDDNEIVQVDHATPPKIPRSPTTQPRSSYCQTPSSPLNFDFCGAIQPQDLLELSACPCCKQCIDERQLTLSSNTKGGLTRIEPYSKSAFDSESMDSSDDEEMLPKGVAEGLHYHPKRILVEGWVHKKGTGQDWLGSTSWKPRWARLVVRYVLNWLGIVCCPYCPYCAN